MSNVALHACNAERGVALLRQVDSAAAEIAPLVERMRARPGDPAAVRALVALAAVELELRQTRARMMWPRLFGAARL